MSLQLIKLTLLDTNLQLDHLSLRSTSQLLPLTRHWMSTLHSISRTRLNWRSKNSLSSSSYEQKSSTQHDGGTITSSEDVN